MSLCPMSSLHGGEVNPRHNQAARKGMPQVVKGEIENVRFPQCVVKRGSETAILRALPIGENRPWCFDSNLLQGLAQYIIHRDAPTFAIFGVTRLNGNGPTLKIDIIPCNDKSSDLRKPVLSAAITKGLRKSLHAGKMFQICGCVILTDQASRRSE